MMDKGSNIYRGGIWWRGVIEVVVSRDVDVDVDVDANAKTYLFAHVSSCFFDDGFDVWAGRGVVWCGVAEWSIV
jgi:hypothetical protein